MSSLGGVVVSERWTAFRFCGPLSLELGTIVMEVVAYARFLSGACVDGPEEPGNDVPGAARGHTLQQTAVHRSMVVDLCPVVSRGSPLSWRLRVAGGCVPIGQLLGSVLSLGGVANLRF